VLARDEGASMSTQLVRYEAARSALAECQRVDEVKDIRDKAEAMAAYARQAKDTEMIQWATEIKVRAERKCGELLIDSVKTGERARNGDNQFTTRTSHDETSSKKKLSDLGLNASQSSRYQQLATMSEAHFEAAVATAKDTAGQVTTAFMLREAAKAKPHKKQTKRDQERLQELQEAKARGVSKLTTYARLTITALRSAESITEDEGRVLGELAELIQNVIVY
jgi:hypothetical protein